MIIATGALRKSHGASKPACKQDRLEDLHNWIHYETPPPLTCIRSAVSSRRTASWILIYTDGQRLGEQKRDMNVLRCR